MLGGVWVKRLGDVGVFIDHNNTSIKPVCYSHSYCFVYYNMVVGLLEPITLKVTKS